MCSLSKSLFYPAIISFFKADLLSILLSLEEVVHVVDQIGARVVLAEALHHQPRPRLQVAAWGGVLHKKTVARLRGTASWLALSTCVNSRYLVLIIITILAFVSI